MTPVMLDHPHHSLPHPYMYSCVAVSFHIPLHRNVFPKSGFEKKASPLHGARYAYHAIVVTLMRHSQTQETAITGKGLQNKARTDTLLRQIKMSRSSCELRVRLKARATHRRRVPRSVVRYTPTSLAPQFTALAARTASFRMAVTLLLTLD